MAENRRTITLLLNYNNYFNRTIKYSSNIEDYKIPYVYRDFDDINFKPNDNISTEIILNTSSDMAEADYLLVSDGKTIISRWYVMHSFRTREGQYKFDLRRDVIADNINEIASCPLFIERAVLSEDNPLILADEGMNLNQIKMKETPLMDETKVGWIVGYIKDDAPSVSVSIPYKTDKTVMTVSKLAQAIGLSATDLDNFINIGDQDKVLRYTQGSVRFRFYLNVAGDQVTDHEFLFDGYFNNDFNAFEDNPFLKPAPSFNDFAYFHSHIDILNDRFATTPRSFYTVLNRAVVYEQGYKSIKQTCLDNMTTLKSKWKDIYNMPYVSMQQYLKLLDYSNKILLEYDNAYYDVTILPVGGVRDLQDKRGIAELNIGNITSQLTNEMNDNLKTALQSEDEWLKLLPKSGRMGVYAKQYGFKISLSLNASSSLSLTTAPASTRNSLIDAPYDAFAIPYGNTDYVGNLQTGQGVTISKEKAIEVAMALYKNYTSANCVDIQLLPYCPCREFIDSEGIDIPYLTVDKDYNPILDGKNNAVSWIFYPKRASNKFTINNSINMTYSKKIESNCINYRLVSPNYNGAFDFNVAKNGGSVSFFNVSYTIKPYSPYVKVSPHFGLLYGQDYNDGRGLICGGDYSMPLTTDEWKEWAIRNKNYQTTFDREIQNLDFSQNMEWKTSQVSRALQITQGTVNGIVGGASSGAMVGGPWGAVAGAVVGGVSNLASGIAGASYDNYNQLASMHEQKQFSIDKYNYQLGNIKALPNSLTKVSAFVEDYKAFPFIEQYTPTNEEIALFESKIRYEGMKAMFIGYMNGYINGNDDYFKASLILTNDLACDYHMALEINNELERGIRI